MPKKKRRPGDGSKLEGAGAKTPNRELHHWWPKGLSKYWADQDGLVSQLRYCGKLHRSTPKTFGAMTNAHAIKLEGPWNWPTEPIVNFSRHQFVAHCRQGSGSAFCRLFC